LMILGLGNNHLATIPAAVNRMPNLTYVEKRNEKCYPPCTHTPCSLQAVR